VSEPEGRGAAWTEERGTSDEGRERLKHALEASEKIPLVFACGTAGIPGITLPWT